MKKENGITLIALVITIIVLLILAGVSIAMITGENGILTQAQNAKNKTAEAAKQEEADLKELEEKIDGVAQVTDTEPGKLEGEGTAENPYTISSIEDLVVFSYEVTNGRTFKKEDGTKEYVQLAQSLDFNSDKSYVNPESEDYEGYGYNGKLKEVLNQTGFIPIGIDEATGEIRETYSFNGDFNGNGYKIYNLKIDKDIKTKEENSALIGMFNANYGTIKNLIIEQGRIHTSVDSSKFSATGLLVGANKGEIISCNVTGGVIGNIIQYASNIGGLVGSNHGIIRDCSSETNVLVVSEGNGQIRVGGITGVNEQDANAIIENVYNTGDINVQIPETNSNDISMCIGGIIGYNFSSIKNAYTIGKVSNSQVRQNEVRIGSLVGYAVNTSEITNCYFLENTVYPSDESITIRVIGKEKTSEQMKQNSFVENLNIGNGTSKWKINSNKNQGYPILYWQ